MNKTKLTGTIAAGVVLAAALFYGYQRLGGAGYSPREDVLAQMPAEASAVLYFDLHELRQSPFLESLYKWVPQTKADPDYAQFLQSTGFNYETDLERAGIALLKHGQDTTLFAVADGRFDQKKISAYAMQTGTRENRSGRDYFSVPQSGGSRRSTVHDACGAGELCVGCNGSGICRQLRGPGAAGQRSDQLEPTVAKSA